jgi:hypothetical protein
LGVMKRFFGESLGQWAHMISTNLSSITLALTVIFLALGVIVSLYFGGSSEKPEASGKDAAPPHH